MILFDLLKPSWTSMKLHEPCWAFLDILNSLKPSCTFVGPSWIFLKPHEPFWTFLNLTAYLTSKLTAYSIAYSIDNSIANRKKWGTHGWTDLLFEFSVGAKNKRKHLTVKIKDSLAKSKHACWIMAISLHKIGHVIFLWTLSTPIYAEKTHGKDWMKQW